MAAQTILSVGIDIGTSTTQVIFSHLVMENTAGYFSVPRVSIVDKKLVYESRIHTTPLVDRVLLDGDGIQAIVAGEFAAAGIHPEDTQTGAVIITGESARKENSAIVLEKLSRFAGEFVVSTAGPDLEAIVAGKGSGAHARGDHIGPHAAKSEHARRGQHARARQHERRAGANGSLFHGGFPLSLYWNVIAAGFTVLHL